MTFEDDPSSELLLVSKVRLSDVLFYEVDNFYLHSLSEKLYLQIVTTKVIIVLYIPIC